MGTKIATMRTLQGHANMLSLHEVFEDAEGFHVVVEFCKGKALLESIHDRVRLGGELFLQAAADSCACRQFLQAAADSCSCNLFVRAAPASNCSCKLFLLAVTAFFLMTQDSSALRAYAACVQLV